MCPGMSDQIEQFRALLILTVRSLVDHPEQVTCSAIPREDHTALRIGVAAGDVEKVIGYKRTTAQAVKTLIQGAALSRGIVIRVELQE